MGGRTALAAGAARAEHLLNRVILYLTDQSDVKADDVRMGGPRIHVEENPSDRPMDAIAVELK